MKICNFLWFFSLSIASINVDAKEYMNLPTLVEDAKYYLQDRVFQDLSESDHSSVKITSQNLDARLKLHACDKPLTFEHRNASKIKGTVSIKVACRSPYTWSIYTKHKVTLEKPIIIANRSLPKNTVLRAQDLNTITRDIYSQRNGYSLDATLLIGKQTTRPISKGEIIYSRQLTQAQMIKKGDSVNVVAKVGNLSVITSGTALSDGSIGEQIDVENRRSSRIIRVEITGKNAVKVLL